MSFPFELRFSHNIIEHLGLKLYQNKPTNVLAELVSNSWDADAENVWINLITDADGAPQDIFVADDGAGMSEDDLTERYLVVGQPKRSLSPKQTSKSGRYLMGRKGIGKLAPFGVAKKIDLVTARDGLVTWLRFDYEDMLGEDADNNELTTYHPGVVCRNTPLPSVPIHESERHKDYIKKFLSNIGSRNGCGTLIIAHNLTIRRAIIPQKLKESLGRRFTVTLARPDFVVHVNDSEVTEKDALPEWEIRIPESGFETQVLSTPHGEKTIKFWAGFVASASWPQEEAGVGIYAHGKIAQDRPFFFGNKGNEIFSRYLYAVVEADWIDELDHDTISTDRTSIDWEDDNLTALQEWGGSKVKSWISLYQKHRKQNAKRENIELVNNVIEKDTSLKVREAEREHLVSLLADVTPRLGKEAENREKLVEATVRAWVHEPARRLIKKLWEEASEFDADNFSCVVRRLADQLVPESLSLAVIFSQRVFALTLLERHIALGKETQLQKLIEEFPWILDKKYESFYARNSLKKICDEAESQGIFQHRNVHLPNNADYTKPDFVFLRDITETKILVVELKGPNETAAWPEYQQLHSYLSYLQSRFADATVEGILVARSFDKGIEKQRSTTMVYMTWESILRRSRKEHMDLLAALLAGVDADATDARVSQICELGGEPVMQFLDQMSMHSEELQELMQQLGALPKT